MSTTKLPVCPSHLAELRAKGWTLRPAARELGVTFNHLNEVLRGRRESRRILAAVKTLPDRAKKA